MLYNGSYATPRPDLGAAYVEYMADPDEYIALQVAPEFPVDAPEGNYSVITRESAMKSADDKRNSNGSYNRIYQGAEDKSYKTHDRGLEAPVDYRKRSKHQKDFDLDLVATQQLVNRLKLNREKRVKALIQDTVTFTGAALFTNISGTDPLSTVTSKFIKHVKAAMTKVWLNGAGPADTLVMSQEALDSAMALDEIKARFPGASVITEAMIRQNLAAIFGVTKLYVGKARENTASGGLDAVVASVWDKKYVMVCRTCSAGADVSAPCIARSQRWTVESPDEIVMEQYIEPQTRQDIIRGRNDVGESLQDKFQGHLLQVEV